MAIDLFCSIIDFVSFVMEIDTVEQTALYVLV